MSADDEFMGSLENLLDKVPKNYGLAEWRQLIRRVVYTVSLRILKTFPEIIVGPPMQVSAAGGPQPPYRPNVGTLLCLATGDCPPPPTTTPTTPQLPRN